MCIRDRVRDLSVAFENGGKSRRVLYNVHYEAYPGEIVGIVGESGCGKSISLLTALQLQPDVYKRQVSHPGTGHTVCVAAQHGDQSGTVLFRDWNGSGYRRV